MKRFGRLFPLLALVLAAFWLLPGCEVASSSGDNGGGNNNNTNNNNDATGDRQKIVGTWRVDTDWRWAQMSFWADGTRSVVDRASGQTLNRGTWYLQNGKLVIVSDVTESCDYTVTDTTLVITVSSGNVIRMTKIN
jgi:hypothetical protein